MRAAALFLSLALLLSVLVSCRHDPAEPEEVMTETVFESVAMPCPTSINYFIRPAADADAVYAVGTQSTADGNVPVLLRFPRDGSPADTVRIPCPEGAGVSLGLFADGKLYFLYSVMENGALTRTLAEMLLVLADPAVTPLVCFDDLPPEGRDFNANLLARDADGLFYLFDYTGVMILDERQAFRGVFPLPSHPSSAATLADGRVWACFREIGESRIACVDPESGNLTESHSLDAGTQTLVSSGDCFGVCDGPAGLSALISAESDPTNSTTPALKSAFAETLASYRGGRIAEGSDGSVFPLREGEDVSAGLKRTTTFRYGDLSDSTIDGTLTFFDRAAAPILESTPDTVTAILTEEISAYLSGVGTAEDCAAKIQSRVSIWLAENK